MSNDDAIKPPDHEVVTITKEDLVENQSRITVVENVYYRYAGENPREFPSGFDRWVKSQEEPYSRRFKLGPDPITPDLAWVATEGLGMLIVENLGPPILHHQPKAEDQVDPATLGIRLRLKGSESWASWLIPVKESARFTPGFDITSPYDNPILLSCPGGIVRCVIHAIPK